MAKDDYYVIVCKILVHLYKKLKHKTSKENEDYIVPLTKDFPIEEDYLQYVVEHMVDDELVENVKLTRAWGGDVINMDISKMRIAPKGIDYLKDNAMMKKIVETLPEASAIISLFM